MIICLERLFYGVAGLIFVTWFAADVIAARDGLRVTPSLWMIGWQHPFIGVIGFLAGLGVSLLPIGSVFDGLELRLFDKNKGWGWRIWNGGYVREFSVTDKEKEALRVVQWSNFYVAFNIPLAKKLRRQDMLLFGLSGALIGFIGAMVLGWDDFFRSIALLFGGIIGLGIGEKNNPQFNKGLVDVIEHCALLVTADRDANLVMTYKARGAHVAHKIKAGELQYIRAVEPMSLWREKAFPLDVWGKFVSGTRGSAFGLPDDNNILYAEPLGLERVMLAIDGSHQTHVAGLRGNLEKLLQHPKSIAELQQWAKELRGIPDSKDSNGEPEYPDM